MNVKVVLFSYTKYIQDLFFITLCPEILYHMQQGKNTFQFLSSRKGPLGQF